jgi:hypothetical protein
MTDGGIPCIWRYKQKIWPIVFMYCIQNFDHLGLFDHSQDHDKKREGALDANAMDVNFGGKQPIMRDTVVQLTDLGQYNPLLTIGVSRR